MKLELTPDQINVVLGGLQEIPHKFSAPVIQEIVKQCEAQAKPPVDPTDKNNEGRN